MYCIYGFLKGMPFLRLFNLLTLKTLIFDTLTNYTNDFLIHWQKRHMTYYRVAGENIVIFTRNADKFMKQNLVPSLDMGMIVIPNLKGEPYIRARRWRDTMDVDPERIHAEHSSNNLIRPQLHSYHTFQCNRRNHSSHQGQPAWAPMDYRTQMTRGIRASRPYSSNQWDLTSQR